MDVTVTAFNSIELAEQVNAAFAAGKLSAFGSDQLASRWGQPVATSWGNGTVSVTVKARTKRGFNDRFVKVGQRLVLQ